MFKQVAVTLCSGRPGARHLLAGRRPGCRSLALAAVQPGALALGTRGTSLACFWAAGRDFYKHFPSINTELCLNLANAIRQRTYNILSNSRSHYTYKALRSPRTLAAGTPVTEEGPVSVFTTDANDPVSCNLFTHQPGTFSSTGSPLMSKLKLPRGRRNEMLKGSIVQQLP